MKGMTTDRTPNSLSHDLSNGFACKCPACGKGKMFRSFLKVNPECPECGEELHHHRADDMPAYYVVMIVGHIVVLSATAVEVAYQPPYWLHALIWLPLTLVLALGLLQPIKGACIALQWRMGMHGFAASKEKRVSSSI